MKNIILFILYSLYSINAISDVKYCLIKQNIKNCEYSTIGTCKKMAETNNAFCIPQSVRNIRFSGTSKFCKLNESKVAYCYYSYRFECDKEIIGKKEICINNKASAKDFDYYKFINSK